MNLVHLLLISVSIINRSSCFVYFVSSKARSTTTSQLFGRKNGGGDRVVLKDLMEDMKRRPEKYNKPGKQNKKTQRTRKRVDTPKQTYVYANQRPRDDGQITQVGSSMKNSQNDPIYQAKELGLLNVAGQHCETSIPIVEPKILGKVRVGEDTTKADSYAYIIEKPIGWAILGSLNKKSKNQVVIEQNQDEVTEEIKEKEREKEKEKEKEDDDDNVSLDLNNLDDADLLKIMTPKEIAEYKDDMKNLAGKSEKIRSPKTSSEDMDFYSDIENNFDELSNIEWNEKQILSSMTPEQIAQMESENSSHRVIIEKKTRMETTSTPIESASFQTHTRPSVVNWFKNLKAEEGSPIRGGNYWKAIAGASNVDDSGLVVICPKDMVENLFINYAKYVAVVGNGKFFAAKQKDLTKIPKNLVGINLLSKVKNGRSFDQVSTVDFTIVEDFSTCNHVVQACQERLGDGIRGDPAANPFDRRAPRRLIHCDGISVSSLAFDDEAEVQSGSFPDDIAIVADRRNDHCFNNGSFLGRDELTENLSTNAYREINGAADGFPGWTVDRYDKWLLVQHDDQFPRGPLPSIHDGKTTGVYYLNADQNREMMGNQEIRPILLEGRPAPDSVQIQENGVTYLVTLDKDLSTGIFLDQRLQRGWLARNCNDGTRILNCFAHCGAFSVAAASAGASTLSLDLNKKYLERIPTQLDLNGIDYYDGDRHDFIYGDCFDWLARLSKRGEKFDILILDPPSTSIGTKKKRWSVKNDMAELVSLAAPLVKKGGFLWTTTNSAALHPIKFAKMCRKGLLAAGQTSAKLERVTPMPGDFPSIGTPSVTNLIWKIQ